MVKKMDLEKNWKDLEKKIAKKWDKLTHEDLAKIKGKKDELVKFLKEKYEWTKEEATKKIDEFMEKIKD